MQMNEQKVWDRSPESQAIAKDMGSLNIERVRKDNDNKNK